MEQCDARACHAGGAGKSAASQLPSDAFARGAILSEACNMAKNPQTAVFNPMAWTFAPLYALAQGRYDSAGVVLALVICFAGVDSAFIIGRAWSREWVGDLVSLLVVACGLSIQFNNH